MGFAQVNETNAQTKVVPFPWLSTPWLGGTLVYNFALACDFHTHFLLRIGRGTILFTKRGRKKNIIAMNRAMSRHGWVKESAQIMKEVIYSEIASTAGDSSSCAVSPTT